LVRLEGNRITGTPPAFTVFFVILSVAKILTLTKQTFRSGHNDEKDFQEN